ncbi:acetoin dehydrogenase dihydrolipoyllysine-residue acetyltransferase subunit [Hoeflea sp.]|uniref:acetoin dehydrogenase dihydrolipoyllysine-residue acetyltransferase subunit n=1 Tax=Hoeflea sp. TaxID=1940281 RepID=UPI003748564B
MPVEVIMPKVDMDMATGKIAVWHIETGNKVEKGVALFDIETDKAAMEVEAPATGYLHHTVPEGTEVPIGAPVAWLYAEGEAISEPPKAVDASASNTTPEPALDARPEETQSLDDPVHAQEAATPQPEGVRATPLARSLARDAAVRLEGIAGSGPRGRIQGDDVREFLSRDGGLENSAATGFEDEAGPLAVARTGKVSGIPVVLIHGFANDATGWLPLERSLRDRPVIRIDLPCHGKSPKRRYKDFQGLVSDLRRALDSLPEERVHIVAHSLGGALSLALADTRPHRVESLTLIAPAGLGAQINSDVLNGILRATRPESLAPWLRMLVADESLVTDGYVKSAMSTRSNASLRLAQASLADTVFPDGVQAHSLIPALHRLEMPVRILWGKKDAVIPWKHALTAPGRVALHLFENLGHMPHVEAPEEVGLLLRTYL